MFTAPNDINNLVHSKLKLSELKISGIQGARSLPCKLNFFGVLQQPVKWGIFLKLSYFKAAGARFWREIPCSKKFVYKQSKITSGDMRRH